jgi:uncharacterized Zn finger protein
VRSIANILHRETIAVIVGSKTFERGEQCFAQKRVLHTEASRGELRGRVVPAERGRAPYAVRIWVRDEGVAYECTCPIGANRQFCKHTVAIALHHLEIERMESERELRLLREALCAVKHEALIEQLLRLARREQAWSEELRRLCLDALSTQ